MTDTISPSNIENLTVIKGIGKARQEWLRAMFHVHTLHDLANLSADDIEARLKAEGQIVSHSKIEGWIDQARQLAGATSPSKPVAQFVVEFQQYRDENDGLKYQTRVHHMEGDKSATWPGIEQAELCAWMVRQSGCAVTEQPGKESQTVIPTPENSPQQAESSERLRRLLAKVQAQATPSYTQKPAPESSERYQKLLAKAQQADSQPPIVQAQVHFGSIQLLAPAIVHHDQPFTLQACFESQAPQTAYTAQFYAHQRETGAVTDLGICEVSGRATVTAALSDVRLGAGVYRLQVMVRAAGAAGAGYGEIPFVQVI